MNNLIIPPNPNWFMPEILHNSPNGVFYSAMTKIVYIKYPLDEAQETCSNIKIFDLKTKMFGFSLDPVDGSSFAIISEDYCVCVFMLDSGRCVKGHKGHYNHEIRNNRTASAAICYTRKNKIISSKNSDIISYCVLSNTFVCYSDISKKNPITILKDSPFTSEIAAGTRNGLILIFNENFEMKFQLRGHDMEITSLDWIKYIPESTQSAPITLPKSMFVDDSSDIFDIYSFVEVENEFGAYKDRPQDILNDTEDLNCSKLMEEPANSSNFNFVEACNNLKDTILGTPARGGDSSKTTYESNQELYGVPNEKNYSDESNESISSSHTPQFQDSFLNLTTENKTTPQKNDFVVIEKKDSTKTQADTTMLASGSKENFAWIWNVDQGLSVTKVKWPGTLNKFKSTLPTPFTSVVWINQNTLMVNDSNGDLLEYNITMKENKIKAEKVEKKFLPKGVLNICKARKGDGLWTSSIHRQIFCLSVEDPTRILIRYDTLQLRIHFIIENPIDSNVIAIGGNDRRICLWNTSSAEKHQIVLKPFMTKIHTAILCLSWHPKKENLLAFSTREGRIGLLDTNQSNNVPIILRNFTSKEIYSIAWANFNNTLMLLACDSSQFVYYVEKGGNKYELTIVPDLSKTTSIFVSGEYLFVGTGNGNVLLCKNGFEIISTFKVCKKYVGQITANENTVVVCADNDIHCFELSDSQLVSKRILNGHTSRVCSVRFNKSGSMLVSTCFAGVIKIWDMNSFDTLANFNLNTPAYSALFLPTGNDKIIVCGGQDSTVVTFDWTRHTGDFSIPEKSKNLDGLKGIEWAQSAEIVSTIKSKRIKRKVGVKNDADDVTDITKDLEAVKLVDPEGMPKTNTLFPMSSKELSMNPIMLLQQMLEQNDTLFYNQKMFAEKDSVKQLIDDELNNYKEFGVSNNVGAIILPQLKDSSLKQEIIDRISTKSLTETHVAIAPTISFEFWKNCCEAYAMQCLGNENYLKAIPYLLATDNVDVTIETLCANKYFREAWIVAKMRKSEEDAVFSSILKRWIQYFEQNGFFEAAAVLFVCSGDYKNAVEILNRRKTQTVSLKAVLDLLNQKTKE